MPAPLNANYNSYATEAIDVKRDFQAQGDGISDDTAAITRAFAAAATYFGGAQVFFPPGVYLISSTLVVASDNIEILGAGWGTIIMPAPGMTGYLLQVAGPGGAGNFRYGIRIANIFFTGLNQAGINGIDLVSCYAALLDHVRARYVPGISVHWDGINGAFGAYNYMRDCHITDGGANAVGLQTDNSEWLTVQGCEFGFFSGGSGIGVKLQNLNNRIIGTSFDHNDTSVQVSFTHRNIILACQFDRGSSRFIYLQSGANNVIAGNLFCNSSGGADIIRADGANNDKNVVSGNTCTAGGGWTNFVNEIAGIGGQNQYIGNDAASYAISRQTGVFRANRGYNPTGAQTPPAVPASTTPLTNPFGFDCIVHIAGGTVSAIAIGGTSTGLTGGTVRVGAGQTITLTYTVAPTWTWFGE